MYFLNRSIRLGESARGRTTDVLAVATDGVGELARPLRARELKSSRRGAGGCFDLLSIVIELDMPPARHAQQGKVHQLPPMCAVDLHPWFDSPQWLPRSVSTENASPAGGCIQRSRALALGGRIGVNRSLALAVRGAPGQLGATPADASTAHTTGTNQHVRRPRVSVASAPTISLVGSFHGANLTKPRHRIPRLYLDFVADFAFYGVFGVCLYQIW